MRKEKIRTAFVKVWNRKSESSFLQVIEFISQLNPNNFQIYGF